MASGADKRPQHEVLYLHPRAPQGSGGRRRGPRPQARGKGVAGGAGMSEEEAFVGYSKGCGEKRAWAYHLPSK